MLELSFRGTFLDNRAATEEAPAPSATILASLAKRKIANFISSSETIAIVSTYFSTILKLSSPGFLTAIPSVKVSAESNSTISPASIDFLRIETAFSASAE